MKSLRFYLGFVAMLLLFLSACTTAPTTVPTVPPTQVPPATETPQPSHTPVPSNTATPAPSATPTQPPTATATATQTASATPKPVFAGFQVDYAQFTYYGMLISFKVPGIKENYRLKVNNVDYTCNLNDKAPDHIYCYGTQFNAGQTVTLSFLPLKGSDAPVFETKYVVAPAMTPTVGYETLMAQGVDKCAVRGVHVTCETEYRRNGDTYCIVSTCVDYCGYYYSVDTCPSNSIENGMFPMVGTPPMPGNR